MQTTRQHHTIFVKRLFFSPVNECCYVQERRVDIEPGVRVSYGNYLFMFITMVPYCVLDQRVDQIWVSQFLE